MLNHNEVTIGGIITKKYVPESRRFVRLFVEVPKFGLDRESGQGQTVILKVDVQGDNMALLENAQAADPAKDRKGDFFFCKGQLIPIPVTPDGWDKPFAIPWIAADTTRPVVVIPEGQRHAGPSFNEIVMVGFCAEKDDLKEVGANKRKLINFKIVWNPRKEKDEADEAFNKRKVWMRCTAWGGTAENWVNKYLNKGDTTLVRGRLSYKSDNLKVKDKPLEQIAIDIDDVQFETPVKKGGSSSGKKPAGPSAAGYDDDLPF